MKALNYSIVHTMGYPLLFVGLFLLGYISPAYASLDRTSVATVDFASCKDRLSRIDALQYECKIESASAKASSINFSDSRVEVRPTPSGYVIRVSRDWHPKRPFFTENEAKHSLDKATSLTQQD